MPVVSAHSLTHTFCLKATATVTSPVNYSIKVFQLTHLPMLFAHAACLNRPIKSQGTFYKIPDSQGKPQEKLGSNYLLKHIDFHTIEKGLNQI